jgi:hypothetical protein
METARMPYIRAARPPSNPDRQVVAVKRTGPLSHRSLMPFV